MARMANDDDWFQEAANIWDLPRLYRDLGEARYTFTGSATGLTRREKLYLRGLLMNHSPNEIAEICFLSVKGLRSNLSKSIYRYAEVLTNRDRNTLSQWHDIIKWLEPNYRLGGPVYQTQKDHRGLPRAASFYGRDPLIDEYQRLILKNECSVLGVFGMGGIGKTALANRLQNAVVDYFPFFIWRKLDHPVPLEELVNGFEFITDNTEQDPVEKLMKFLREHRCLLVLDNWDSLLQTQVLTGEYCEEHHNYQRFLNRIIQEEHQSCVIITSREELRECTTNSNSHDLVHYINLTGLNLQEATKMLQDYDLQDSQDWPDLINIYQGHPWSLKLVADDIKQAFGGEVSRFLEQHTLLVLNGLENLIQEQLDKLSALELEITYAMAIERLATSPEALQEHYFTFIHRSDLVMAVSSLARRSLIYKVKNGDQQLLEMGRTLRRHLTKIVVTEATQEIIKGITSKEKPTFDVLRKFRLMSPEPSIKALQEDKILRPITLQLAHYCRSDRIVKDYLNFLKGELANQTDFELGYTLSNIDALLEYVS